MYVINLISINSSRSNDYGYYAGTYRCNHETFPIFDKRVTERTKKYKSKIRAINGAEKIYEKCGYVESYKIEELIEI